MKRSPRNIQGVGTSFGATILGNVVARESENCILKGAVLVCGIYEGHAFMKGLEKSLFGLYDKYMSRWQLKRLKENESVYKLLENLHKGRILLVY